MKSELLNLIKFLFAGVSISKLINRKLSCGHKVFARDSLFKIFIRMTKMFFFIIILDSLICSVCLWEPNRIQCQSVAVSSGSGKNLLQCKPTPKCSRNVCAPSKFFSCFLKTQSCWINTITVLCFLYKSYCLTRISNIKINYDHRLGFCNNIVIN